MFVGKCYFYVRAAGRLVAAFSIVRPWIRVIRYN